MKNELLRVSRNEKITSDIFAMTFDGQFESGGNAGRFIEIALPGFFLRRPFSVATCSGTELTIIYRVVGKGTSALSKVKAGCALDVIFPLGNGFNISRGRRQPVLVGGGIGVPPLFGLCEKLLADGVKPQVVMGYNSAEEIILTKKFEGLGVTPVITTVDGTEGIKGFVTDALCHMDFNYIYACGPMPMLKALYDFDCDGQFSFEARMACGFGACMGCTIETALGPKRVCKDGPIFFKEEIIW